MRTIALILPIAVSLCLVSISTAQKSAKTVEKHPIVILKTNMGTIEITLDAEKAPLTVGNFLSYVNEGFYDSTVFHRVIPKFMIQGGGFTEWNEKKTKLQIKNEGKNGLSNRRGTIAMARTKSVHSATSQFFINLVDNFELDKVQDYGYAVFGKVTSGMNVVDKIAGVKTRNYGGSFANSPVKAVIIEAAWVKK
jgi:peptidyl-prolyl cis-trans isomerase A (cyclophilin A)